ncbi:hypothetical protein NDU88_004596 [Pleurodeles waltl]|uniref:Uncharacterized protein n=1 Tax=Pleurodeles waltl TaxID=8319 RepID=A0AAV7QGC1_PLEWA|nr:hypothetical protein NDU88_004596 [Pleurodeles waltl]
MHCDGSDRSDPHSIAPSAVSACVDPEATQRAALPIGSTWFPRDEKDAKGEVRERQAEFVQSGNLQTVLWSAHVLHFRDGASNGRC